eukprot:SAG11_NODE_3853_length_2190_cov_2.101865_1_plen_166_part_00
MTRLLNGLTLVQRDASVNVTLMHGEKPARTGQPSGNSRLRPCIFGTTMVVALVVFAHISWSNGWVSVSDLDDIGDLSALRESSTVAATEGNVSQALSTNRRNFDLKPSATIQASVGHSQEPQAQTSEEERRRYYEELSRWKLSKHAGATPEDEAEATIKRIQEEA